MLTAVLDVLAYVEGLTGTLALQIRDASGTPFGACVVDDGSLVLVRRHERIEATLPPIKMPREFLNAVRQTASANAREGDLDAALALLGRDAVVDVMRALRRRFAIEFIAMARAACGSRLRSRGRTLVGSADQRWRFTPAEIYREVVELIVPRPIGDAVTRYDDARRTHTRAVLSLGVPLGDDKHVVPLEASGFDDRPLRSSTTVLQAAMRAFGDGGVASVRFTHETGAWECMSSLGVLVVVDAAPRDEARRLLDLGGTT